MHPESTINLFWSRVNVSSPDACWNWTGTTTRGYGKFQRGTRGKPNHKNYLAHRLSYEIHYGTLPSVMKVCHTCDNRLCVNPAHLFLGTDLDNVEDMVGKDRQARGESIGISKLTEDCVREIRRRVANGETNASALAREYGISNRSMWDVVHRRTWLHIH